MICYGDVSLSQELREDSFFLNMFGLKLALSSVS